MTVKHQSASAQARHDLSVDPMFATEVDHIPRHFADLQRQLPRLQRQSAPAHDAAADPAFAH